MTKLAEIFISVDVEATGPIPGEYSMSSIGAFVAGGRTADGHIVRFDHEDSANIFYAELKPISEKFVPEAIKVGLLDGFDTSQPDEDGSRRHDWMKEHGQDPKEAMEQFVAFVEDAGRTHGAGPIFMAYPASFDWTFVYWYLVWSGVKSPFGFSRVLDLKSVYSTKANAPLKKSTKRFMPKSLFPDLPHTHRADDDAVEQGVLGMNILAMESKTG